jgi:tRNA(fMet)-specific endonuclease VapC
MPTYHLDTSTLSYAFRNEGQVAQTLRGLPRADVGIPAPVLYEARAGMLRLPNGARRRSLLTALDRLCASVEIVPFDAKAAEAAARIRATLEQTGSLIGPIDIQIASVALSRGAVLVTHNTREFERVTGLLLEDWY